MAEWWRKRACREKQQTKNLTHHKNQRLADATMKIKTFVGRRSGGRVATPRRRGMPGKKDAKEEEKCLHECWK